MKEKKEIVREIVEGKSTVSLLLSEFEGKHCKVMDLNMGKITIPKFIELISVEDPFSIIEFTDNKYIIANKQVNFPLNSRINQGTINTLDKYYDDILVSYPELSEYIAFCRSNLKEGCTDCNKNSYNGNIINYICHMGGIGRNVDKLYLIFGNIFTNILKDKEPEKFFKSQDYLRQILENSKKGKIVSKNLENKQNNAILSNNKAPRKSCLNCVRKHIATAIPYFNEFLLGYKYNNWLAIGEMVHAEMESVGEYPELANKIREERLKCMEDSRYIPELVMYFEIIENIEKKGK